MTNLILQIPDKLIPVFTPERGGHYVYVHKKKGTGVVFYVGKGKNKRAWSKHSRNIYWHRTVKLYGIDVEILRYFSTHRDAISYEVEMISWYRSRGMAVTNLTDGGDGTIGYIQSKEQRRKNSEANKGRFSGGKNPMCKPEVAAKMGLTKIGNKNCVKWEKYKFNHPKHGQEYCSGYELRLKYNLNQTYVSKLVNGKVSSAKGWVIDRG